MFKNIFSAFRDFVTPLDSNLNLLEAWPGLPAELLLGISRIEKINQTH